MLTIRRFEERSLENYTLGKIGGFLHLYIGEEAVAVGTITALERRDHVITHYRDHGYAIARGVALGPLMAELFGKATGVSKGKGGSMHLADVTRNLWGGYAIVGGHLPLATGLAFASQYLKEGRIVAAYFGDGATDAGAFHESMNLASVWKLPVVFICENNEFGMGVRVSEASATATMSEKAANYNMPVRQVDGMDPLATRQLIRQAIVEEMERDERVFIMGEDIDAYGGSYAVTAGLARRFGKERVRDTPISETVIVGAGCGAAMGGLRPIVELMTINFSLVAMDQIINNAAKIHSMFGGQINVPLVIRAPAGWTQLSATHSQSLEAWFAHTPGLKVVMPSTPYDHKGLLKSAVRDPDPVMYIEHTLLYGSFKGDVPDGEILVQIGQSDVKRAHTDITIVTYSRMVQVSLKVAERLAQEGIEAEIGRAHV